ncbi:MAG: hypothetical protein E7K04_04910 [Helicobacter sp.]|nr:hypothetical protein [Helicobacter sp.]
MKKLFLIIFASFSLIFADWQMFSDKDNTFLYNTKTGEVYIKKMRKNGEFAFVKMDRGLSQKEFYNLQNSPNILDTTQNEQNKENKESKENALKAIQKSQDILLKALDSGDSK